MQQIIQLLAASPEQCFHWSTHSGAKLDLLVIAGNQRYPDFANSTHWEMSRVVLHFTLFRNGFLGVHTPEYHEKSARHPRYNTLTTRKIV